MHVMRTRFPTIRKGKKVPVGCWREESGGGSEQGEKGGNRAGRRRREEKSSRDELGGAAKLHSKQII